MNRQLYRYLVNRFPFGYNIETIAWSKSGNQVLLNISCGDHYADPRQNHDKEDLEETIIKKLGYWILKDNEYVANKKLDKSERNTNTPTNNPSLKSLDKNKRDGYRESYHIRLSKDQLQNMNRSLIYKSRIDNRLKFLRDERFKPAKILRNSSYKPDNYLFEIGKWF